MTSPLTERYVNIPEEMRLQRRWCWHRLEVKERKEPKPCPACGKEHLSKTPRHPGGTGVSCKKPSEWRTFNEVTTIPKGLDGISFVLGDGIACIDLDGVRNPQTGDVTPEALAIIQEVDSYTEISESGCGFHIFVKASLPKASHRENSWVEMYAVDKIIAMTGDFLFGQETLVHRDLAALFARAENGVFIRGGTKAKPTLAVKSTGDASADDFALACRLARQCSCDFEKTKAEFLRQAAPRPKLQRQDYIDRTISNALARVRANEPLMGTSSQCARAFLTEKEVRRVSDTDLPEVCLDGWLGDVCRTRMSAFPRAYAWLALLASASVLVPRETKFRCNLYVDLDGPVHSGKSSAFEMAFHLLSLTKPSLLKMKAGSAEGLAEYIGDAGGAPRLLYPDELAHLLEKSMIERSSFARFLTSAFYDDLQELTVAKRKPLLFNARLSLAGGTVDDQFGDLFGAASTGGLYDRFLFGKCPSGYQYLWRPIDDEPPAYVPTTGEESMLRPVAVSLHPSVFQERDRWVNELGREHSRVAELCLRAAIICASFDGRKLLTPEMLAPAFELAKYQVHVRAVLQPNPGENPDARMSFTIRNWMMTHAGDGQDIARRLLYKMVSGHRLGPGVFDRAVRAMEFNGELETGKVGKQAVVRWIPDPSASTKLPSVAGTSMPIVPSASASHAEEASSF